MKNKKSIYILLPVVLLIWTAIFYRIYSGTGGEETASFLSGSVQEITYQAPEKKVYELLLNYPDPFLSARAKPSSGDEIREAETFVRQDRQQLSFHWERVRYKGLIEHPGRKTTIALVEYLGKNYMLQKGAPEDNIHLLAISRDSIKVKIGSQTAYVRKYKGN